MNQMSQVDLNQFFDSCWSEKCERAHQESDLSYSNAVEDQLIYPIYKELISSLGITVNGGKILDVGCGSGRWIRYFTTEFKPKRIVGIDLAAASIELLEKWYSDRPTY